MGLHSTIDKPESVILVMPPMIIMATTNIKINVSQFKRNTCCLKGLKLSFILLIYLPKLSSK